MTTTIDKQAAETQKRHIEEARRLLKPRAVSLNKVPRWLTERLRAYRKAQSFDAVPTSMLLQSTAAAIQSNVGGSWLDHWGTATGGPFKCCHEAPNFVSEPYSFDATMADSLNRFCDALGLTWHLSSNSWWYPGSTVQLVLHEKAAVVRP
jgi:hypothetical protein